MTGEGKTCIIIGLAIYHVLKNHKVDIVTSNEILAIRDSTLKKNVEIYKLFNIEVSHCISSKDRKKKCYDKSIDIVYGDTHNFQADFLHENYYSENIKNWRGEDINYCWWNWFYVSWWICKEYTFSWKKTLYGIFKSYIIFFILLFKKISRNKKAN